MITLEDVEALEALDAKLRAILPEQYRDTYQDVQPVSMGSAGLRYDVDGRVAWDQIWGSFCDLALAGGPPHRGTLLAPAPPGDGSERYDSVAAEICRGISMVTGLAAEPSQTPGWVRVRCKSVGMAAWLVRAIVAENILARHEAEFLYLPAGPEFRLEKEIKNVITAVAKTCHYWTGHIPDHRQRALEELFANPAADAVLLQAEVPPLLQPELLQPSSPALLEQALPSPTLSAGRNAGHCSPDYDLSGAHAERVARAIHETTGLTATERFGWLGIEFAGVAQAIWMMRALIVENIVARREATTLLLPLAPLVPGHEARLVRTFTRLHHLGQAARTL